MYAHKLAYYALDNKIVDKKNVGTINPMLSNNPYYIWRWQAKVDLWYKHLWFHQAFLQRT